MQKLSITAFVTSALFLSACGGGGSGTTGTVPGAGLQDANVNTSVATVSEQNQKDISVAATVGLTKAISSESGIDDNPFGAEASEVDFEFIKDHALNTLSEISNLPVAFSESMSCSLGGSMKIEMPGVSSNAQSLPSSGKIIITYNNCNESYATLHGTMTMTYSGGNINDLYGKGPENFTMVLAYSVNGVPVSGEFSCSDYGETCTYADNFVVGGTNYRIENSKVNYDESSDSYNVEAKIYAGELGYIELYSLDITISGGAICSGTASVIDSTGASVLTITYDSCYSYTVTFNGQSITYDQ